MLSWLCKWPTAICSCSLPDSPPCVEMVGRPCSYFLSFLPVPTASTFKQLPQHPGSPLPHSSALPLPFPQSASSLLSLLSRCCMHGINIKAANNWGPPSQIDHTWKRYLTEGGDFSVFFEKSNCEKQVTESSSISRFLYHLMVVTIETDKQTELVSTKAVSISRLDFYIS